MLLCKVINIPLGLCNDMHMVVNLLFEAMDIPFVCKYRSSYLLNQLSKHEEILEKYWQLNK